MRRNCLMLFTLLWGLLAFLGCGILKQNLPVAIALEDTITAIFTPDTSLAIAFEDFLYDPEAFAKRVPAAVLAQVDTVDAHLVFFGSVSGLTKTFLYSALQPDTLKMNVIGVVDSCLPSKRYTYPVKLLNGRRHYYAAKAEWVPAHGSQSPFSSLVSIMTVNFTQGATQPALIERVDSVTIPHVKYTQLWVWTTNPYWEISWTLSPTREKVLGSCSHYDVYKPLCFLNLSDLVFLARKPYTLTDLVWFAGSYQKPTCDTLEMINP